MISYSQCQKCIMWIKTCCFHHFLGMVCKNSGSMCTFLPKTWTFNNICKKKTENYLFSTAIKIKSSLGLRILPKITMSLCPNFYNNATPGWRSRDSAHTIRFYVGQRSRSWGHVKGNLQLYKVPLEQIRPKLTLWLTTVLFWGCETRKYNDYYANEEKNPCSCFSF